MKARYRYVLGRRSNYPTKLELEVYAGRNMRTYINVGYDIPVNYWDETRQEVKGRMPNSASINNHLKLIVQRLEQRELTCITDGQVFDKTQVWLAFNGKNQYSLTELFDKYFTERYRCGKIRKSSLRTYHSCIAPTINLLGENVDVLHLTEATLAYIDKNAKTTIVANRIHSLLASLIKGAIKDKLTTNNPYQSYTRSKIVHKQKKALTDQELAALENIDRSNLRRCAILTLDKFLFSVYTGLRISDNNAIKKSDISETSNGLVLSLITIKTHTNVTLPLRDLFGGKAEKIALDYLHKNPDTEELFPKIGRITITRNIGILRDLAGISCDVTFHTSRHTCATMLAEKCGDPYIIKQVLGHSDISIGMKYVHESADTLRKQLKGIKW